MSAAVIEADTPAAPGVPVANPWLIAILVALASFMEVLDTTIANVALPYIAGGMGVSEDEARAGLANLNRTLSGVSA